MSEKNERLQILEMIDNGTISPDEGARLIKALTKVHLNDEDPTESSEGPYQVDLNTSGEQSRSSPKPEGQNNSASHFDTANEPEVLETPYTPFEADKWRRWWTIPLWIGVGITVVGGVLMYAAMQAAGASSLWFACAWLPFLLGTAVILIAWSSRSARWIHIRVQQSPGERPQKIALSFPIPIRLTAWILRHFGHHIPNMEQTGLDEIILALGDNTSPETPFYVEVDEGEDGEKVEIYIG
jgi:hypothetical protein